MTLYGFFHSDCIYESAYALVSLHRTKRGAWKAMHLHQWEYWLPNINTGYHMGKDYRQAMRGYKSFQHCASRVRAVEVVE